MKQELQEGMMPEEVKNIVTGQKNMNRARAEADGNSFRRGNVFAMLYCGDRPLIVIGPHCK